MADYYYDDPIDYETPPRRKAPAILASILVLLAGGLFLNTTLAANIRINSGTAVEFGQGITTSAACSGSSVLTMTPNSSFVNSSGGGSFYFTSLTVSGIPTNCNGVDFNLSAYSDTGNALPLFNTNSTIVSIWDNGNTFQGGKGWLGSTITSGSGSFTVSFNSPVALASNVAKISLQSLNHVAGDCITEDICALGDTGPGGGLVFYVGAAFTMTGATCNTTCNYLEWAPVSWASTQSQNASFSEPGTATTDAGTTLMPSNLLVGTSTAFGTGLNNTSLLANAVGSGTSSNNAAKAARLYAANDSSAGQWFLPSKDELIALFQSAVKSRGNFQNRNLWSSSEQTAVNQWQVQMTTGDATVDARSNFKLFRPIRAF